MTRCCPWKKRRPAPSPPPPPPKERPSTFVRGEYEFQIVGYSMAGDAHYSVLSDAFHVGGHSWALDCRFDQGDGHLASVSLELLTTYIAEDCVVAKAGLKIKDPLGRLPAAEWRSDDAHTFTVWTGGSWQLSETGGRSWKLSLPDAFRGHESRYVDDDRLTIHCNLEVLQEEEDSTLADHVHSLLPLSSEPRSDKRAMMPDVTFVVEQTEIQAHSLVLAMRSPGFAAELLGNVRQSTTRRVQVDDMRASTFRAMVRFIYTDKLPIKAKTNDSASKRSPRACKEKCAARRRVAMACDLLVAADRYDLEKLRLMCENILSESMDVVFVMPTLMAVHGRHNCRQLEASCIEYLASNADVYAAVKATEDYKELEESSFSFLVEVTDKVATHKLEVDSSSSTDCRRRPNKMSVSTYNMSEVVHGMLEFRIPHFSSMRRSRKTNSETFHIADHDWRLFVYIHEAPKDTTKDGNISLYAELLTDPGIAGLRVSVCFRMDDPSGKSAPIIHESQFIFTRKQPGWGCGDFTTAKYVDSYYLAHDGSLTIHCEIEVANNACTPTSTTSAGARDSTVVPPLNIAWHLGQLLMSEKGSDVTFLVEHREIRAHKLVIATRALKLYELVRLDNKKDQIIPVTYMKAAVFDAMLHFIYTNELPPMEDIVFGGDMLLAAHWFRLDGMKAKCETLLAQSITEQNVLSTLNLAHQFKCFKLLDYCDDFLSSPYVANDIPGYEMELIT